MVQTHTMGHARRKQASIELQEYLPESQIKTNKQTIPNILIFFNYSEVLNKRPGPNNFPGWKQDQKLIAVQGQINVQGRSFCCF